MAIILHLETATTNCSVSISKDNEIVVLKENNAASYSHSEQLHVFIKEALKEASLLFSDLDAVAISKGPGSYTGLRIGVSAAKGICFSLDIPLVAVHTLQAMNEQVVNNRQKYGLHKGETNLSFIPMIDARRMEVYSAVFNIENEFERDVEAEVL